MSAGIPTIPTRKAFDCSPACRDARGAGRAVRLFLELSNRRTLELPNVFRKRV